MSLRRRSLTRASMKGLTDSSCLRTKRAYTMDVAFSALTSRGRMPNGKALAIDGMTRRRPTVECMLSSALPAALSRSKTLLGSLLRVLVVRRNSVMAMMECAIQSTTEPVSAWEIRLHQCSQHDWMVSKACTHDRR